MCILFEQEILFWYFWLEIQCISQDFKSLYHHHIIIAQSPGRLWAGLGDKGEKKEDGIPPHNLQYVGVPFSIPLVKKKKRKKEKKVFSLKFLLSESANLGIQPSLRSQLGGKGVKRKHETQVPHPIP